MKRAWINQPSVAQPLHHLHGVQVLADGNRVWFLDGATVSMEVPAGALSLGWRVRERARYFLCRYVRTEEVMHGSGFATGLVQTMPLAPSYVYRLHRVSPALLLTAEEARHIEEGLACEEGTPHLKPEAEAIEGKRL